MQLFIEDIQNVSIQVVIPPCEAVPVSYMKVDGQCNCLDSVLQVWLWHSRVINENCRTRAELLQLSILVNLQQHSTGNLRLAGHWFGVAPSPPSYCTNNNKKDVWKENIISIPCCPPFFLSIDTKDTGSGDGTKRLSPCSLLILYINVNNQR